jgi:hypothetical protein
MTNPDGSLFDELDDVLRHGPAGRRVDMVRRVTDLFPSDADRSNEQQIGVFDHGANEPDESTLLGFAQASKYQEMVVAMSLPCSASREIIKPLIPRDDGFLLACKGRGKVSATMDARLSPNTGPKQDRERLENDFAELARPSAERLPGFRQLRHARAKVS